MLKLMLATAAVVVCSPGLFAVSVIPFNTRPVTIGSSAETPLQTVLNSTYGVGVINAETDQQTAGLWMLSTGLPGSIGPVITLEVSGNGPSTRGGLFSAPELDTAGANYREYDLFLGAATTNDSAIVTWNSAGTMFVNSGIPGGCGTVVNCTTSAGIAAGAAGYINPNSIGFYINVANSGTKYYTTDSLNPGGSAQALAYRGAAAGGGTETWTIAFEDILRGQGDNDYNDFVIKVESLKPVPEPTFYSVLAVGLSAIGWMSYRRRKNAEIAE